MTPFEGGAALRARAPFADVYALVVEAKEGVGGRAELLKDQLEQNIPLIPEQARVQLQEQSEAALQDAWKVVVASGGSQQPLSLQVSWYGRQWAS